MKTKELLCVALVSENGERYDAEIYTDGTFKKADGEIYRLTPHEFEIVQVLARRANREKMLTVVANDVVPYREGDKEPDEYVENLLPYTETDFLLPGERVRVAASVADQSEGDPEVIDEMLQQQMDETDEGGAKKKSASGSDAVNNGNEGEAETANDVSSHPIEETAPQINSKKKKAKKEKRSGSKAAVILVVMFVLLLLCGAGFGMGYIKGYINVGPLHGVSEPGSTITSSSSEATVQPTPSPVPPKTEINLTINAVDGAEVSGSTDVGVNEGGQSTSESEEPTSTEQTSR